MPIGKLKAITGTWRGEYCYDVSPHIAEHAPVSFTLILKQGWFGKFSGSVTDSGPGGVPGSGTIEGYFSFPRMEFIKRMPVYYVATVSGGNSTLREHLIEQGHPCERDVPHPPIFYEGEFTSPTRARGTWIIRGGPVLLGDGATVETPKVTGCWSIERCSEKGFKRLC